MCDSKPRSSRLGDVDLARLVLFGLGNLDRENAVLHRSLDVVGVDADREGERTREFADAALTDPNLLVRFGVLLLLLGDLGFGGSLGLVTALVISFIFDGGLMRLVLLDRAGRLGAFDEASWRCSGSVSAFGAATDDQGLGVGEFDFDILLLDAWKFAVKFVSLRKLLDIKLGREALHDVAAAAMMTTLVSGGVSISVKVVEETEERVEGRVAGNEGSWEERHLACWYFCEKSSCELLSWEFGKCSI